MVLDLLCLTFCPCGAPWTRIRPAGLGLVLCSLRCPPHSGIRAPSALMCPDQDSRALFCPCPVLWPSMLPLPGSMYQDQGFRGLYCLCLGPHARIGSQGPCTALAKFHVLEPEHQGSVPSPPSPVCQAMGYHTSSVQPCVSALHPALPCMPDLVHWAMAHGALHGPLERLSV